MNLFPRDQVAGAFLGFSEGGLEFHADLVLPYQSDYQNTPMHGQFLVVQLETEDEAVLGRITSMSAQGRLASGAGEDFALRAIHDERPIPEDLRTNYLKYRVNIRVLGVLKLIDGRLEFVPSHRRLPHVGSKVAFLSDEVLREVAGHNVEGAELGFFALGEFVFHGDDKRFKPIGGHQGRSPKVIPRFNESHLVARRSFVFARAGFGKSNLVKLLFSNLYEITPQVPKRGDRKVPVGTVIFDPDGEYYWPDDKNRPGLCDVPHLQDKVVVFTNKRGPSPFYQSFVAGGIKLDIRRLRPADVVAIALTSEKQDQQNVRKLKSMRQEDWSQFVDEIFRERNNADPAVLRPLLRLEEGQEAELYAARANMTQIVGMLHDPSSQMLDMLLKSLSAGKLCVVDVSQMRGAPALVLSGLVLQRIFDHNQEEFTKAEPQTIPTIAVVEEAQTVLGSTGSSGDGPYVSWVKEGRKYDLGAVLITQQPGSIGGEILSQGDNWFVFHLLSAGDLVAVKKANAHFSDDILSSLLNEPIIGQGVFWSSVGGTPYPIPLRVMSFESLYGALDPEYSRPPADTFAAKLKAEAADALGDTATALTAEEDAEVYGRTSQGQPEDGPVAEPLPDALETYKKRAIDGLRTNDKLLSDLRGRGVPWRGVVVELERHLPDIVSDKGTVAYQLVARALNEVLGPENEAWHSEYRPKKSGQGTTLWVAAGPAPEEA